MEISSQGTQKNVLITGAKGVLGSAVVSRFAKSGHTVTGTILSTESIGKIDFSDACHWIPVDLSDSKAVKSAFAESQFDIWIHCAGGFRFGKMDQFTDEDFDFLLNTNLKSAFYLTREILPGMKKRNFGRIIFIGARITLQTSEGMGPYAASKAGINLLTTTLAEEVRAYNITANAILPSVIDTPMNRNAMPDANFSDWVKPEQLADIIYSLVSTVGDPINGALIPVSGRL